VNMASMWLLEKQHETIGTITANAVVDGCPHCSHGLRQRGSASSYCPDCWGGHSRHVVKVACSDCLNPRCHWFSRAPLMGSSEHVGVYCYHRLLLNKLVNVSKSFIGVKEELEQLNWLVAGYRMESLRISHAPLAINTFHDYELACRDVK